jgi:hypothetical protein
VVSFSAGTVGCGGSAIAKVMTCIIRHSQPVSTTRPGMAQFHYPAGSMISQIIIA